MKKLILVVALGLLTNFEALGSFDSQTSAIDDGIGYRSNLIDPANPYGMNIETTFRTLLNRYVPVPDYDDFPTAFRVPRIRLTPEEYAARVKQLLSPGYDIGSLELALEKYHYSYECGSNDYPAALAFMDGLVGIYGRGKVADSLIRLRHTALSYCELSEPDRKKFMATIQAKFLRDGGYPGNLTKKAGSDYAGWIHYLLGALNFYEEQWEQAENLFAKIDNHPSPWLRDTARFMTVRIAKANLDRKMISGKAFEEYLTNHLKNYPNGLYFGDVENFLFLAKKWQSPRELEKLILLKFDDLFRPNASAESMVVQTEKRDTVAFYVTKYDVWRAPELSSPLLMAFTLISEIHTTRYPKHERIYHDYHFGSDGPKAPRYVSDESEWKRQLNRLASAFSDYPGLEAYSRLLWLYANGKHQQVVEAEVTKANLGPLFWDGRVLRARSLAALSQYGEAIDAWKAVSNGTPTYNSLTEIATLLARKGRFADFGRLRLDAGWMTDLSYHPSDEKWTSDEFHLSPREFHKQYMPYRNLLRRGFEALTNAKSAAGVYLDQTLPPLVRFYAGEPVLRTFLLEENYRRFMDVSAKIFDSSFRKTWIPAKDDPERNLIEGYQYMRGSVSRLMKDSKDPVALTDLGYFLYKNHRFRRCENEDFFQYHYHNPKYRRHYPDTLWEDKLAACTGLAEPYAISPIDIFDRALSVFRTKNRRTKAEARLLRIMIYCFKGNEGTCLRNKKGAFPKFQRRAWFQRLHKYFPKEEHVPYWF